MDAILDNPIFLIAGVVLLLVFVWVLIKKLFKLAVVVFVMLLGVVGYNIYQGGSPPDSVDALKKQVSKTVSDGAEAGKKKANELKKKAAKAAAEELEKAKEKVKEAAEEEVDKAKEKVKDGAKKAKKEAKKALD